jgi:serine/threonine protein phosphatase PrpC
MTGQHVSSALHLSDGNWHILAASATGASHLDKGLPCQDACMAVQQYYSGNPYTVVAVADGHGSERYTRSEIGAHLAMETVHETASELIQGLVTLKEAEPSTWRGRVAHEFEYRFGKRMLRQWRDRIVEHARNNPEENVESSTDASIRRYGSTVALCVIFEQMLMIAGIGDSSIYVVNETESGIVTREAYRGLDAESVGLATDSLCSPQAAYAWQTTLKTMSINNPSMVLLTTDGMTDSLDEPDHSVRSIYEKTTAYGIEWLQQILPDQLRRWSDEGVGDDMGFIVLFPSLALGVPADKENSNALEEHT